MIKKSNKFKIVVLGHNHFSHLEPKTSGVSEWGYANTGTWLKKVKASTDSKNCFLKSKPSALPYVKISKEKGQDKALLELKYFRGTFQDQLLKVKLISES